MQRTATIAVQFLEGCAAPDACEMDKPAQTEAIREQCAHWRCESPCEGSSIGAAARRCAGDPDLKIIRMSVDKARCSWAMATQTPRAFQRPPADPTRRDWFLKGVRPRNPRPVAGAPIGSRPFTSPANCHGHRYARLFITANSMLPAFRLIRALRSHMEAPKLARPVIFTDRTRSMTELMN